MARPASMEQPPTRLLLVEGQDDRHVILQLCDRSSFFSAYFRESSSQYQSTPPFKVSDEDGVDNLLNSISVYAKQSGMHILGIVVDANDNLQDRWNAVTGKLLKIGIQAPASPAPTGTIIEHQKGQPRVGIWLMPDNQSGGELEDFLRKMIPANDTVWPLSQQYIKEIPAADRKFKAEKTEKAKFYAWLATRNEPGRMGAAIGTGDLEMGSEPCTAFLNWLKKLFG